MATDKPRFTITLDDPLLAQIEEYQSIKKLSTKSKAIQALLEIGLEEYSDLLEMPASKDPPAIDTGDLELLDLYHQLDAKDQGRILGRMEQLLENDKYKNEKRPSAG